MPLDNQKAVMAGMDLLAGKAVRRLGKGYQRGVVGPMVRQLKNAKSLEELLRHLGPTLLREMDSAELEETLADAQVQAGLIGRTTARPRGMGNEATKADA